MKLQPIGDRVVVRRKGADEKIGMIIVPDTAKEQQLTGTVVACGPGAVDDKGILVPLDVEVGDEVLFNEYAGNEIIVEDKELLVLRENDILGIVT